jgi:glycosyltransferase involved in cell wall biosynthesis
MGSFLRALYREGKQLATGFKPDIVIASSTYPMDIWPAHRIARQTGAKLVFEIHDLWPLTPMELGGISKWHPFIMLLQAAENYVYRHADAVVSMLPKVHDHVEARGMPLSSLYIVPNGVDPREWRGDTPRLEADIDKTLLALRKAGNFIVGYAGTHGVSNALHTFLDTSAIMRDEKVSFVLVGSGPEKPGLQRRARMEQLRNVFFIDPVVKEQIPALLQHFDVAYIGWKRHPLYRFGIAPNKLMDYMMAARPVLHAVEAGNDPVGEAGCGLTVAPEDAAASVEGVRSLLSLSVEARGAMGLRGKEFVLANHTYPILSERFLAACA